MTRGNGDPIQAGVEWQTEFVPSGPGGELKATVRTRKPGEPWVYQSYSYTFTPIVDGVYFWQSHRPGSTATGYVAWDEEGGYYKSVDSASDGKPVRYYPQD